MSAMKKLTVIVPAYNEEANIGELLSRIKLVEVDGCDLDMVVVDDGSTDATCRIAGESGAKVVAHAENRGLGAAVRTALSEAVYGGADVVAYLDADLEYSPEDIPGLVEPVLCGRADYVLGRRIGRRGSGMRLYRRVGNVAFSVLLSVLAGRWIEDGQTGMRGFSRAAASEAEVIHDYNYAQVLTLDLLGKGFRMEEVAISYRVREHGESFVDWRYPMKLLPAIWREVVGVGRAPEDGALAAIYTENPVLEVAQKEGRSPGS